MRKLAVFNLTSLDGYIADQKGDMSWAHKNDAEWNEFLKSNTKGESVLVFGRVTHDLMVQYWPTPMAKQNTPEAAEAINAQTKIVFSRTLDHSSWNNTTVIKGDIVEEVRRMKSEPGPDLVILGSGSIVAQLTKASLIDQYQVVICPVVLGAGKTMFEGIDKHVPLTLAGSRVFKNGNVVLTYRLNT